MYIYIYIYIFNSFSFSGWQLKACRLIVKEREAEIYSYSLSPIQVFHASVLNCALVEMHNSITVTHGNGVRECP